MPTKGRVRTHTMLKLCGRWIDVAEARARKMQSVSYRMASGG